MQDLDQLKRDYHALYVTEIRGVPFVWRPLTRPEWIKIQGMQLPEYERWDEVCRIGVVHPEDIDFGGTASAGLASLLGSEIEEASGFGSPMQAVRLLNRERERMEGFESQMEVIIATAFPHITFEAMGGWPLEKLLRYVARAEWQLKTIQGVPIELNIPDPNKPEETPETEGSVKGQRGVAEIIQERMDGDPMLLKYQMPKSDTNFLDFPFILGTQAWRKGVSVNVRTRTVSRLRPSSDSPE